MMKFALFVTVVAGHNLLDVHHHRDCAKDDPTCPKKQCQPVCSWHCTNPKCEEKCKPICSAPICKTYCKAIEIRTCQTICDKPDCRVICPKDCAAGNCPKCQTVCGPPPCKTTCQQDCESKCAEPVCTYECERPHECPKPECHLNCDNPCQDAFTGVNSEVPRMMGYGVEVASGTAKMSALFHNNTSF